MMAPLIFECTAATPWSPVVLGMVAHPDAREVGDQQLVRSKSRSKSSLQVTIVKRVRVASSDWRSFHSWPGGDDTITMECPHCGYRREKDRPRHRFSMPC
jgi:hypothetical protein